MTHKRTTQLQQVAHALAHALLTAETPAGVADISLSFLIEQTSSDGGAFGLSSTGRAEDYLWLVDGVPKRFLAKYAQHSDADFIRQSTAERPNTVLRDTEMVTRRSFLENYFVQSSADYHFPIKRVMGVVVADIGFGEGGVALYRTEERPFSEHERDRLAVILHVLAAKMRSTAALAQLRIEVTAAKMANDVAGRGLILVDPYGRIQYLNGLARKLMALLYPSLARGSDACLPNDLVQRLVSPLGGTWTLQRATERGMCTVQFSSVELTDIEQPGWWCIILREPSCVPPEWLAKLERHETDAVERALRGWSNRLIAEDLEISVDAVKKRLERAYNKLGLPNRATMIAVARCATA